MLLNFKAIPAVVVAIPFMVMLSFSSLAAESDSNGKGLLGTDSKSAPTSDKLGEKDADKSAGAADKGEGKPADNDAGKEKVDADGKLLKRPRRKRMIKTT